MSDKVDKPHKIKRYRSRSLDDESLSNSLKPINKKIFIDTDLTLDIKNSPFDNVDSPVSIKSINDVNNDDSYINGKEGTNEYDLYTVTSKREQYIRKLLKIKRQCSKITDNIYIASDHIAKDREILRKYHITHIINCAAYVCDNYHDDLIYHTIYINDRPYEDIVCLIYDIHKFIAKAINDNKNAKILYTLSNGYK